MDAKAQVEMLMNELLSFAEKMLSEHGGFHPFGGYVDALGRVVHVGVQPKGMAMSPNEKVDAMVSSFKELARDNQAEAFAIVTDVVLPADGGTNNRDAIKFFLEHEDGYCAEVFFPYMIKDGKAEVIDTVAQQGDRAFFTSIQKH